MIKVGITIGDINGIGPETILKVLSDNRMMGLMIPVIYGSGSLISFMKKQLDLDQLQFQRIKSTDDAKAKKINVLNIWDEEVVPEFGKASKESGQLAWKSLKTAVDDLASNKIDVLVTSPINKDTIQSEEFKFPGHTEYLASMSNVDDYLMLLIAEDLRVGVVTGHLPLKDVAQELTSEKILSKLELLDESLKRDFGIVKPHIAVLGLNPHAGDNGLLGDEEQNIIQPAIREANEKGMLTFGPYGADGFFGSPAYKKFDAVLAMYHDQGLGPFKAMAFDTGVNFTAGLPIVRTSPDHGTGYNIAGKGEADPSSLRHAIFTAVDIYNKRKEYREMTANPLKSQDKKSGKESDSKIV